MCVHANEERQTNLTFVNKTSENVPKEAGTKLPSDLFVKADISINVWLNRAAYQSGCIN